MVQEVKKQTFVELRALGLSLAKISTQIGVSKPTLINWQKEFKIEIVNAKAIEIESIRESFRLSKTETAKRLLGIKAKLLQELEKRDLADVPTEKLLKMVLDLDEPLEALTTATVMVKEEAVDFLISEHIPMEL